MPKLYFSTLLISHLFLHTIWAQAPVQSNTGQPAAERKYNNITAILGAFPPEVVLLQAQMKDKRTTVIQHISFTEGLLNGQKVVLAQTGIGKVNAAITTTLLLEYFSPREVIFTGIAGAIDPDLSPGDLVIATKVAHHDYGNLTPDGIVRRPTRNPFTMAENPLYFICDSLLMNAAVSAGNLLSLEKINTASGKRSPKIITGVIVTGDVFVASTTATQQLRQQMNASATEMEGAAVGQVCWQQQVPFIVIRSMSDNAGNNAPTEVKSFYAIAAQNSAQLVMAILKELQKRK